MEINPQNEFGQLLLDLLEAQYEDLDTGIEALMETTSLSEDEVVSILEGSIIVDEEDLLSDIIDAFPDADDDTVIALVNVAADVDEADRQEVIDEIEANEAEMEGGEDMDMGMEEDYSYAYQEADFGLQQENAELRQRLEHLEHNVSNFAFTDALSRELDSIDSQAAALVANQVLPPAYKKMLIGDFKTSDERLARFSDMAAENGVDPETMVFATRYALGMLQSSAPFMEFRDYSTSEDERTMAEFSASLDSIVQEDIDAIFNS